MDEHTPNPNPETAAESGGVGSPAGVQDAASESPPVDPQAELQDLDASLSEMTNLLMSGEDGDAFDLEGDFADADGLVADAPPRPQPNSQPDPLAEIDQVQAVVEAALQEAAGDLGGASELDDAAEPLLDPQAAMEAVAESLEDQAAESEPPVAEFEASDEAGAAPEAEAEAESPAGPHPAAPTDAAPVAHAERQAEQSSTAIPAPGAPALPAPGAAASGGVPADSRETAPRRSAVPPAVKADLKTRLLAIAGKMVTPIAAKVGELLARGIEPLAAVLAGQPKLMRHSLAWLALWTAFNAGTIWFYLIFFRSTGHEADPAAMTQISGTAAATAGEATGDGPGSPPAVGAIDPATAALAHPAGK